MAIIYLAISPIGKQYVGATTKSLKKRKNDHYQKAMQGRKTYFANAVRKYGIKNFVWAILENCSTEKIDEREIFWIKKLNTLAPNGYNLDKGGRNGLHSEETKKKLSLIRGSKSSMFGKHHTKESKKKMSLAQKGHPVSDEARRNMSEAHKGKYASEETKKKMSLAQRGKSHVGGWKLSEETKKKMSLSRMGEKNHFFGKHHTEETKRKISKGLNIYHGGSYEY